MIKIKLSQIDGSPFKELEIVPNETLRAAAERSLEGIIPTSQKLEDHFVILVNGLKIEKDFLDYVKLSPKDNVLIAPAIKGGDGPSLLRSLLILTATAFLPGVIAPFIGVGAQGTIGYALLTAGVTIAASGLFLALIPPPNPELDSGTGDTSSSQMYSVTGQSNQVKRYQTVPKVYGTHRMFPVVAASPYTELEADPASGNLVQYFYAVYDFGLGPMEVRDIKIGDTPIEDFSDVQYRLVDFNKPLVSEGTWDDALESDLLYYKGDIERDSVSVAINGNEGVDPISEYQVTRTAPPNTLNDKQELNVTLVNPAGLYAFSATGERGPRTIDLDIEFSKVGEDIWRGFNDLTYVDSYVSVGGSEVYTPVSINIHPPDTTTGGPLYPLMQESANSPYQFVQITSADAPLWYATSNYYGLPAGANTVVLADTPDMMGKVIKIKGRILGKVIASAPYAAGYTTYTFDTPLTSNLPIFRFVRIGDEDFILSPDEAAASDYDHTNKATYEDLVPGRARISRNEQGQVYSTFKFTPKDTASYKIRITRKQTFSTYNSTVSDALNWAGISSRFDRAPIVTPNRHVFLEIRIRATNQLNGSIQNLSAICSSALDVYDDNTQTWSKQLTANPAWVFCDLLTGEINKRALDKSRLSMDSIVEWAEFCDEVPTPPMGQTFTYSRFYCNMVLDYTPTLQTAINQVTNAAQASINVIDGKYGVLVDKLRTVPVQVFTPRNSSGFSSTRSYTSRPHALKVTYIDPAADWEARETIVYDDGYDIDTATEFEEINSFACTNPQQAWRFGRYMLAQNRLRQERISITVDFENLVCTRGDYVQITQDVMRVGGTPARVKSVSGNQITIDDAIETTANPYGFVFRRGSDGAIVEDTLTVINATTFDLDGSDFPNVGDLIVIGEVGNVVFDCIVKSIEPIDDLKAVINLVEKADGIYSAESTDVIPDYEPQISQTASTDFAPPNEVEDLVVADSYYECNGAGLDYKVDLDWDVPSGPAYDIFEVWVDSGKGYNFYDYTKESFFTYPVLPENVGLLHKFKVLAVSATGKKLDLGAVGEVTQTVTRKDTPPSDIAVFNADITGEVLQLFWERIADCSCEEYIIRYSPTLDGTWERSIPLLRVDSNTSLASFQARTGTYLIKAVDFEGNESENAAAVITTIPNLFGLNVIDETTDFPALLGPKDRVVSTTGALTLDEAISGGIDDTEYYSEGYYYYENLLDLGEIYTVRLQSLIQAEGFTLEDLMSEWTLLSEVDALSHAGSSDWDVETYYRTTDTFNVIADWTLLSDIDPISEGNQDIWTEWKKFTIGDATGRIFQFRLRLVSNKVNVTPRVFDGTIKADMPDRFERYNNLSAPTGGLAVAYTPSFKGPGTTPNIQISIDTASSGDYWTFDYKTLDGFYIRFFDKDDNPVSRQFDAAIAGYGRKATAIL